MNARTTALSALIATRRQNAWSDGVLKEYIARDRLDARDAALASRLCYGVLQNRDAAGFLYRVLPERKAAGASAGRAGYPAAGRIPDRISG